MKKIMSKFKRWWELRVSKQYCENPMHGAEWRNLPCVCFSGQKMKNCCGKHRYVSTVWAKELVSKVKAAIILRKEEANKTMID